jgi:hypothetical protein
MPQRNITDEEIRLIKAMLKRGYKNNDIQLLFNRPDRKVNAGRISQIKNGSYGPPSLTAASDQELNDFEAAYKQDGLAFRATPLSKKETARSLFEKTKGKWRLKDGETDQHECKQDFDPKKLSPVLCAIAAMSNNRGGFLFLGVSNADCCATGVSDAFADFDNAKLMDKVKVHLAPTPRITTKGIIDLEGTKVGFIHIEPHPDRPVIVSKDDGDKLKEGEILFRYAGQSMRIKSTDLRDLLAERDRRAQLALASAAGKLATVGAKNALILDTDKNVLDADGREILIDEELARNINFIREGQFNEVDGAPTLKLIGEVKPVNAQTLHAEKHIDKAISEERLLTAFVEQKRVNEPIEYILAIVSLRREWLPLFYFIRQANISQDDMVSKVEELTTSQTVSKEKLIKRIKGEKSAYTEAKTNKARATASDVTEATAKTPNEIADVLPFCQAIFSIKQTKMTLEDMLTAVKRCYELANTARDRNVLSNVFKLACRIDEIFFRDS